MKILVAISVVLLLLSGCAPKPEKLQDNIIVSLNLNLNQQKAASKFPKNPEELQAGDWAYAITAEKWRQRYFPSNADVQIKYLTAHATTIVIEGKADLVLEYSRYLSEDMGATANIVQLSDDTKPRNIISLIFVKRRGEAFTK